MISLNTKLILTLTVVIFSASCAQSAKKNPLQQDHSRFPAHPFQLNSPLSSDQVVLQELTGKAVSQIPTQKQLKLKPLSTQHYFAGLRAAESKNYIMAIKHFNTVLKKFPHSPEVKPAFQAKAKVYTDMGLSEPADLNLRLSQSQNINILNKKSVQDQGQSKIKR